MRQSKLFAPTLRETPAEAEIISHQLMLRAGMIRKSAAGMYTFLPLAQRVIGKIAKIVREEMDREEGQELALPIVQPAEIWKESGRWEVYGDEMFRLVDRHKREFCLGPTHEEIITTVVKNDIRSYRDLPLRLYQIQNKYRDEIRPRFGLMRGREFIMKDLYSFDLDEAGLEESYQAMYRAYTKVFTRCGLKFRPVEADSGAIGGNVSQEFMVLAEAGEALILYCDACNYAANIEKAVSKVPVASGGTMVPLELIETPGQKTIDEVSAFLKVAPEQTVKTLFYGTGDGYIAVLVRGCDQVNEIKLYNSLGGKNLYLASPEELHEVYGLPVGYVGPVGLDEKITIYADNLVKEMHQVVVGANREGYHYRNVEPERDFVNVNYTDLRTANPGEACPRCHGHLQQVRGIEAGQIFKLGTKYSKALGATYLDEKGQSQLMVMGCYGIGVSRTMAAAIEQNYDANGIKWPMAIAPFQVHIVAVSADQLQVAADLYKQLNEAGIEVLVDDRNERPGVKFKDADLIGIPIRITVGPKGLAQGEVEVKYRQTGAEERWPLTEVTTRAASFIRQCLSENR
ncbi:prolyl-tRNA synthetase [Hydrogenispora ethanolica]|uniref:Proline--tRNA ligase n=1 Tax=Hydrogenispora ethanolica TaxID=1082276 RepID=A0A4R1RSF8_HYDET|nr:proline--tRNA ligase [Hydrogenispora ethanolica]TCL69411.1 prolyl-tRNA synthetase [Hydrogenispora ethanolica]